MFTQQVEVAAGSNQAKILVGVIEKFTNLLLDRQKHWIININNEVVRLLKYNELYDIDPHNISPEDQCAGGLLEYLIAVSNDQMRAADYTMALSTKYGEIVSKIYEKEISKHMNVSLDGFAEAVSYTHLDVYKRQVHTKVSKVLHPPRVSCKWICGIRSHMVCGIGIL